MNNNPSPRKVPTAAVCPAFGYDIRVVERPPTWRGHSYSITYLMSEHEPAANEMVDVHHWAKNEKLPNPRIISPSLLQWSSLFNPRFFDAVAAERGGWESRLTWTFPDQAPEDGELAHLWLQTKLFLAGVTLSAAIIQSRHSQGTIASKYDHLWEAGVLAESAVVQELRELDLQETVRALSSFSEADDVERLIEIRKQFMAAWALIAPIGGDVELMTEATIPTEFAGRFGFIDDLRNRCGSRLHAIIAYGSSVSSQSFADYDLLVVTEDPEALLRRLAGQSPKWCAKEMNMGIYSPDELVVMQRLSGDNLADYGVCLWGATSVVRKPVSRLLIRNLSFGVVRQRQQLGMLSRAIGDPETADVVDRRNLYDYFVKIPANVAKGTLGALGERWSKERVQEWMMTELGFDTVGEQRRAELGYPAQALANSALTTGKVLATLNERVQLVRAPKLASDALDTLH
jgi:hypothetical protein